MNPVPPSNWIEVNQRHLMEALAKVRHALEEWLIRAVPSADPMPAASGLLSAEQPSRPGSESAEARDQFGGTKNHRTAGSTGEVLPSFADNAPTVVTAPSALEAVCAAFHLSPFERDLLLLCAGPDLDTKFTPLIAKANGDPRRVAPTFSLALATLPNAHWSALLPTAPLRRWRLIEVGPGDSLTSSPLRIDEWLLHFLAGAPHQDERLQMLVRPVAASAQAPSQRALSERLTRLCQSNPAGRPLPLIQLCGDLPDDLLAAAGHMCATLGCRPYRLAALDVPTTSTERETFSRIWEREAALSGSALLVDFRDAEHADASRAALPLLESIGGLLFVLTREPLRGLGRDTWKFNVPNPSAGEQHELWRAALGPRAVELNGQLEAVAGQFCFSARDMAEVATVLRATEREPAPASPVDHDTFWSLCRSRSRTRLESLAQRIEPAAVWDDLVLPELQLRTLREIAVHIRQRFRVYEQWGFATKGGRGLGISALFAGASGTGKTMAAEVLANELKLDLYRIDLSAVVSKYIGETEKNLRRVFDAAEAGGAILLFDEADALFGKRSEVKDSHDRYANIEVGYLLQRMETYRGLAILTTNFKQALDTAFLRRLRFVVQFPFPDAAQRAEIWRRAFPSATPVETLDALQLARLNVAGGNIRNIALSAAFLAADAGEPVCMKHLAHAARTECAKLERPSSEAELGGWI